MINFRNCFINSSRYFFLGIIVSGLISIVGSSCGGGSDGGSGGGTGFTINNGNWSGTTDQEDDITFEFINGEITNFHVIHNICGIIRTVDVDYLTINAPPDNDFVYIEEHEAPPIHWDYVYRFSYQGAFKSERKISGKWNFVDNECDGSESGTWTATHVAF